VNLDPLDLGDRDWIALDPDWVWLIAATIPQGKKAEEQRNLQFQIHPH
jgi:hypothetical protein